MPLQPHSSLLRRGQLPPCRAQPLVRVWLPDRNRTDLRCCCCHVWPCPWFVWTKKPRAYNDARSLLSRFLSVALTSLLCYTYTPFSRSLSLLITLKHTHTYACVITSALYFPSMNPPISCDPTLYPSLETFGTTTLPPARPCSLHPPFLHLKAGPPFILASKREEGGNYLTIPYSLKQN
jgi:hypothetical protein